MTHVLSRSRGARLGVAVLAGGLLLAGCSSSKSTAGGSGGGTSAATSAGATSAAAASSCPALGATPAAAAQTGGTVTIYSADGLHDDKDDNNWYNQEFKKFTALTGIQVKYVEDGSGGVETRVKNEASNPQADVMVTLPPFIQKAEAENLLQAYTPVCADKIAKGNVDPNGQWEAVMGNYLSFIYNSQQLTTAPKSWQDLLDPKFKGKLQYSTPGVAGDGTAVMIKAIHDFGSADAAMAFFKQLQPNNVGPSKSTGALEGKVNKGDLLVANGDVQMNYVDGKNSNPNNKIWFPADANGTPTTFSLPYMAGLVKGAPNAANGKKLIDFLLSEGSQKDASAVAYGFPSRTDIVPTDANYTTLQQLMAGVTVFPVDWNDVASHYADYVSAWDTATGTAAAS